MSSALLLDRQLPHSPTQPSSEGLVPSPADRLSRVLRGAALRRWLPLFIFYVASGSWLINSRGIVYNDAVSRVDNASGVLWSRTPHLAAIGFVWNPLPTFAEIPATLLHPLFPGWVAFDGPAILVSAAFMAGSTVVLEHWLRDLGIRRWLVAVLTIAFAFDPMIWMFGSNGMSEAMQVFFLLVTGRNLSRWLTDQADIRALVKVGVGLALGYLTRYEVLATAASVTTIVALRTWTTSRYRPARWHQIGTNLAVVMLPFLTAFLSWITTSKIIVGDWFATISSNYGNSKLVKNTGTHNLAHFGPAIRYLGRQMLGLEPAAPFLLLVLLWVIFRRKDWRPLAGVVTLGSVLAFDTVASASGNTFGFLRFDITIVPLALLTVGYAATKAPQSSSLVSRREPIGGVALIALVGALAALISTPKTMSSVVLNPEDGGAFSYIFGGTPTPAITAIVDRFKALRGIGADLDRMPFRDGDVLTDSASSFQIVLASHYQKHFVITPDLDFERALAAPRTFGVNYFLIQAPGGTFDALENQYPGLYETGSGIATLVHQWDLPTGAGPAWRLYKLTNSAD